VLTHPARIRTGRSNKIVFFMGVLIFGSMGGI